MFLRAQSLRLSTVQDSGCGGRVCGLARFRIQSSEMDLGISNFRIQLGFDGAGRLESVDSS